MKDSKLIKIIGKFDTSELKAFDKFVRSPYFYDGKRAPELIALYTLIYKSAPEFSEKKLKKEVIYEKIFPGTQIIKGKLEKLSSELLKLVNDFITVQYSDIKGDQRRRLLAQAGFFRAKQMDNQFQLTVQKLETVLSKEEIHDKTYYHQRFLSELERVLYNAKVNSRTLDLNLPGALRALDVYYLVAKLEYTIWLQSQNVNVPLEMKDAIAILEKIIPDIEKEDHLNIPVIRVYKQAYLLLKKYNKDSREEFLVLGTLLEKYENEIDPEQVKALQTLLRIYAVGQYNRGDEQYLSEAFALYQKHLKAGYLHYNGKLFPGTIRNVVMLGLRFSQADWVLDFLTEHEHRITGTQFPEDVYQFNIANYYFYLEQYDKALDFISGTYEDIYYKIAARRLEIKIYFELQSPLLDPRIEAFKIHIFRIAKSQLPEKHRTANNDFIDILKQVINPRTLKNKERIEKLKVKISSKNILAEKQWLAEKMMLMD